MILGIRKKCKLKFCRALKARLPLWTWCSSHAPTSIGPLSVLFSFVNYSDIQVSAKITKFVYEKTFRSSSTGATVLWRLFLPTDWCGVSLLQTLTLKSYTTSIKQNKHTFMKHNKNLKVINSSTFQRKFTLWILELGGGVGFGLSVHQFISLTTILQEVGVFHWTLSTGSPFLRGWILKC